MPYEQYLNSEIDFSQVGLNRGNTESIYLCTPEGAKVIGWTGVDGIHYCFIEGFQEVFSVNPMAAEGENVHPVARNFSDFLRLLLACKNEAAIEQAHGWDREQFEKFLTENPASAEQEAVLKAIEEEFSLSPMEDSFSYIKGLQAGFDYRRIPYKEGFIQGEYFPQRPEPSEWKVYFHAGFHDRHCEGSAGEEIPLNKTFTWGNTIWHIPSAYSCQEGLVIDFCIEAGAFEGTEKHNRMSERDFLELDFRFSILVNQNRLDSHSGYGMVWEPETEGTANDPETGWVLKHYGLSPDRIWKIQRINFPWETVPELKSLQLDLTAYPSDISSIYFSAPPEGESITFLNPVSGNFHTLTVKKWEALEGPEIPEENWYFPKHFNRMLYTLSPDLPEGSFYLCDTAKCDRPVLKDSSTAKGACSIGIIGGAHCITSILIGEKEENLHTACSSLHFQPVSEVEWKLTFRRKLLEDIQVSLL